MKRTMPAAPGAAHRWVAVHGARLHVAEYGPTNGAPVLLLHGFPQHWLAWREVVAGAPAGLRLICPDLRGFGWSEQTAGGYDIDGLADDVVGLLDALGLARVGLVAHDWGAYIGFRLCVRDPERFTGYLALNMTHPWAPHRVLVPNLWRMWFTAFLEYPVLGRAVLRHWPAFTRFLMRHQAADPSVWSATEIEEFTAATRASAHAVQSMFWQYVVGMPAMLRGKQRGGRLTVPTVLLGGGRDPVISPAMLAGSEPYADDLTVRIVPGAGHFLPQERPAVVAEAVTELFAAGAAPSHSVS
jgi:pimeloyl-ACP methyl ester carboxylesterase